MAFDDTFTVGELWDKEQVSTTESYHLLNANILAASYFSRVIKIIFIINGWRNQLAGVSPKLIDEH